jgi:hypothetical protein
MVASGAGIKPGEPGEALHREPLDAGDVPCPSGGALRRKARDAGAVASGEAMKDGEAGAVIGSRLERVEVGRDADGDAITSFVIVPVEGEAADATARKPARMPKAAGLGATLSGGADPPKQEPKEGFFAARRRVIVDDGTCPAGQIKEVIGGSNRMYGTAIPRPDFERIRRCISHHPPKGARAHPGT